MLAWLRDSLRALVENPSPENFAKFAEEVGEHREVVKNALKQAIRPELRDAVEAIYRFLVAGFQGEKEGVGQA